MTCSFIVRSAFICLLVLIFSPTPGKARGVDPYVGAVPVLNATESELGPAFEAALRQVMQKVTGAAQEVIELADAGQLGDARGMVVQHGFVQSPLLDSPDQRMLRVRFSPELIAQRVRELGLPFWPLERPETIAWAAIQRESGRELLGLRTEDEALLTRLTALGDFHGVPLVLPLLDLEDQRHVGAPDVWGGLVDRVSRASERYAAAQTLMTRIFPAPGGGWSARWTLVGEKYTDGWNTRGETPQAVLDAGIAELARRMGGRLALRARTSGDQSVMLRVQGLDRAADYARVMRYLRGLSVVTSADPVRADTREVDIRIAAITGLRGLIQVLETDRRLRLAPGIAPSGIDAVVEPNG